MSYKFKKTDIGKLIEVHFWDHASGHNGTETVYCRAVGWLVKYDKKEIAIAPWETLDKDQNSLPENDDNYALLRSTFISVKVHP